LQCIFPYEKIPFRFHRFLLLQIFLHCQSAYLLLLTSPGD
jgi:hypothetical protein